MLNIVKRKIKHYKERLIRKAKKNGLWENFGQEEVRILETEYSNHIYTHDGIWKEIQNFSIWCMNCDIDELSRH